MRFLKKVVIMLVLFFYIAVGQSTAAPSFQPEANMTTIAVNSGLLGRKKLESSGADYVIDHITEMNKLIK